MCCGVRFELIAFKATHMPPPGLRDQPSTLSTLNLRLHLPVEPAGSAEQADFARAESQSLESVMRPGHKKRGRHLRAAPPNTAPVSLPAGRGAFRLDGRVRRIGYGTHIHAAGVRGTLDRWVDRRGLPASRVDIGQVNLVVGAGGKGQRTGAARTVGLGVDCPVALVLFAARVVLV